MEGDEKKTNKSCAVLRSRRLHRGVDDLRMQRVNWKRVKRMNLIALAPEERGCDTGALARPRGRFTRSGCASSLYLRRHVRNNENYDL